MKNETIFSYDCSIKDMTLKVCVIVIEKDDNKSKKNESPKLR